MEPKRLLQAVPQKRCIRQLKFSRGLRKHLNQNLSESMNRFLCPIGHLHQSPLYNSLSYSLRDNRIDKLKDSPSDNTNNNPSNGLNDQLSLNLRHRLSDKQDGLLHDSQNGALNTNPRKFQIDLINGSMM
jgi:hypothetical protein